ncbi:unnamed protein product [Fusarium graminearum]|uniref:Uncharacterized protein n=1 Tax=Gibberella zeae TaxID=5518 RepID=A0A4U9EP93_GIBZA|nr:unnamed protein product [Fusarium graminearum]CAG1997733.1 unnamed protein product [Fusarium graminearum]VTO83984.1 unnamed protein product [Fusarium graminearum]
MATLRAAMKPTQSVQDKGYPVEVVGLKSSREETIDPAPGLADDVKEASAVLNRHIDQGKDVVLLMHSYGGMGDYLVCDDDTAMCFYSELTKEQGLPLAQAASHVYQAARVFGDEQTYDGFHKLIPSSWILTKKDVLVPEAAQRMFVARLEEQGGRSVPVVEFDTGHSPHQTNPPLLMDTLENILERLS